MSAEAGGLLPSGINVLAWDGDGPAPIQRVLDASPIEADPEREGIRILLAVAWVHWPRPDLAQFTANAVRMLPQLATFDPTLIASVAAGMNLGLAVL